MHARRQSPATIEYHCLNACLRTWLPRPAIRRRWKNTGDTLRNQPPSATNEIHIHIIKWKLSHYGRLGLPATIISGNCYWAQGLYTNYHSVYLLSNWKAHSFFTFFSRIIAWNYNFTKIWSDYKRNVNGLGRKTILVGTVLLKFDIL